MKKKQNFNLQNNTFFNKKTTINSIYINFIETILLFGKLNSFEILRYMLNEVNNQLYKKLNKK